jgi:flagellar biosynthesis/type III secretory pathway protein FliH
MDNNEKTITMALYEYKYQQRAKYGEGYADGYNEGHDAGFTEALELVEKLVTGQLARM